MIYVNFKKAPHTIIVSRRTKVKYVAYVSDKPIFDPLKFSIKFKDNSEARHFCNHYNAGNRKKIPNSELFVQSNKSVEYIAKYYGMNYKVFYDISKVSKVDDDIPCFWNQNIY